MALELPALVTDRVEEDTMSTTIKLAARWDEKRFTQLIPILQKYGVYGICEWTYDIH
jgi:hypothetical protein